jgi:uncharacterized RDD family membrane protein YckC
MFHNFCTRVARKLRRLGIAQKAAARFGRIFYVLMLVTCGLMGLFFSNPQELHESITGTGIVHADARSGC